MRDGAFVFPDVFGAVTTVVLGSSSSLSTTGEGVRTPNAFGRRTGYVLPGGTISVSGNLVAEQGALLDVSGLSATFDFAPSYLGAAGVPFNSGLTAPPFIPLMEARRIDSDGGTITLSGRDMLFTDATLRGSAGGPSALGGSLAISSGRFAAGFESHSAGLQSRGDAGPDYLAVQSESVREQIARQECPHTRI